MLKSANKTMIKDMNTALLLSHIRRSGPVSRADLAKMTGLTAATVSSNTADLIQWEFVREIGIGASSGGRKPTLVELDPDSLGVLAVEIGTSASRAAIVDLSGRIRAQERLPHGNHSVHPDVALPRIMDAVERLAFKLKPGSMKLLGIGAGVHGLVDAELGLSIFAPALHWERVAVRERFEERFNLPFWMDNDVRGMALGEKMFGQAGEASNFVFLNVDQGIGSGIYVNGELVNGSRFGAGEIGHIFIADNGVECFCGKRGCLSTFASGAALRSATQERLSREMTAVELAEAASGGDEKAQALLEETGAYIGRALSILVNILNPEQILIGGELSKTGLPFFAGVKRELADKAMSNNVHQIQLHPVGAPDDSGIVGAAAIALKHCFQNPSQYARV